MMKSFGMRLAGFALIFAACVVLTQAQQPPTQSIQFTATSANVAQSGSPVRIHIVRWSTDEERNALVAALSIPPPPPPAAAPPPAPPPPSPEEPAADAAPEPQAADGQRGRAAQGGRAGGARGRGGRGAAPAPPPPPLTPIASLAAAISKAPTVGYVWTDEVTGYSIKYAYRLPQPGGGERVILATSRRLGVYTTSWTPSPPASATNLDFTLIELRTNAKGAGEGKASLTTGVVVDNEAKTIALENYAATPTILQNVKR